MKLFLILMVGLFAGCATTPHPQTCHIGWNVKIRYSKTVKDPLRETQKLKEELQSRKLIPEGAAVWCDNAIKVGK
jgi:hypothetical protein